MGQTWTGLSCSESASTYTYAQAVALTHDFAGHSDWRLPNIVELQTIVERENYNPAINITLFPNTPSDGLWSASPYAGYSGSARIVGFSGGGDGGGGKGYGLAVRLVRGGQSFGSLPLTTPTSDFINNQDGTVTHKRTGLMWQRCAVGQTWTGSSCSGSYGTYTYDQALALTSTFAGHNDWRVPDANELLSIAEYGTYDPAINTALFPNTPVYGFWSASPYAYGSGYAWIVGFYDGYGDGGDKYYGGAVRLVRDGMHPPLGNQAPGLMKGKALGQCLFGGYCARSQSTQAHNGIDYAVPAGTPVYAVCNGTVKVARNAANTPNIWNRFTIINHSDCTDSNPLFAYYGHINASVAIGQKVKAGQRIGTVGDWGANSHLHLSLNSSYKTGGWGYVDVAEATTADCNKNPVTRRRILLATQGWKDPAIIGTKSGWNPFLLQGGAASGNCNAPKQRYIPAPMGKSLPYYPWKTL